MPSASSRYVRCRACGYRVYRDARHCPRCRHRMRWNWKLLALWAIAVAIGILLGIALVDRLTVNDQPPPTPSFGNP